MPLYKGTCHCNAVEFEVETDLAGGLQCDCSLCKRKNAVMHRVPKEQFRLVRGKDALTLYSILGFPRDLSKLGKYKTGKSCLYIKGLADVDVRVLQRIIESAAKKKTRAPGQVVA